MKKIIWYSVMILSILILLLSGGHLFINIWYSSLENKLEYANLSELVGKQPSNNLVSELRSEDDAILPDFYLIYEKNLELRGWLDIPGTKINYPVVQTKDNKKYLDTDFFNKPNKNGCLFFDKSNLISKYNSSQCLVIYGHNMKTGQMFHDLTKYQDVNFYKENPIFSMNTVYELRDYKIFSCFLAGSEDEHFYNYRKFNFDNSEMFLQFINEIREKSFFSTTVEILDSDSILLLSTCSYEFNGARLVVAAKMVRQNEDIFVDTSKAIQQIPIN